MSHHGSYADSSLQQATAVHPLHHREGSIPVGRFRDSSHPVRRIAVLLFLIGVVLIVAPLWKQRARNSTEPRASVSPTHAETTSIAESPWATTSSLTAPADGVWWSLTDQVPTQGVGSYAINLGRPSTLLLGTATPNEHQGANSFGLWSTQSAYDTWNQGGAKN